jgi:hypothetical protein
LDNEQNNQNPKHIQNIFQNPLEITNYLAGNFGELRANHFPLDDI